MIVHRLHWPGHALCPSVLPTVVVLLIQAFSDLSHAQGPLHTLWAEDGRLLSSHETTPTAWEWLFGVCQDLTVSEILSFLLVNKLACQFYGS